MTVWSMLANGVTRKGAWCDEMMDCVSKSGICVMKLIHRGRNRWCWAMLVMIGLIDK